MYCWRMYVTNVNENQFVRDRDTRSNWLKALYTRNHYSKNTALESLAIACTITRINSQALRQKIPSLSDDYVAIIYRAKLEVKNILHLHLSRTKKLNILTF